jgi:NAD(P)-dependent dehydrogenase (short-subunit alcohol dehydrogenase family)
LTGTLEAVSERRGILLTGAASGVGAAVCRMMAGPDAAILVHTRRDGAEAMARHVRDGGSFTERMSRIACWNSVMDQDRHMIQKWNEFIAT